MHLCIAAKAHPGKITPNGRGSSLAIHSIASCRTGLTRIRNPRVSASSAQSAFRRRRCTFITLEILIPRRRYVPAQQHHIKIEKTTESTEEHREKQHRSVLSLCSVVNIPLFAIRAPAAHSVQPESACARPWVREAPVLRARVLLIQDGWGRGVR